MSESNYTVGDLRKLLALASDDAKITFDGGLTVYRARHWDDGSIHLEFNEPQAELTVSLKMSCSNIQVAFLKLK